MICGLLEPAEGNISWGGENIRKLGEEFLADVSYLGHRNGIKDEFTSIENLRCSSGLSGIAISEQTAATVLQKAGLASREHLPTRVLSEGQRRRVALSRLSLSPKKLWILDEVLTSLDKNGIAFVRSLISEHLIRGGIAIVATHQDLDLSPNTFERIQLSL
jgi:heme exporter protein A